MINKIKNQAGFAALEFALVLVIIGLIGGVGYWVASQRKAKNSTSTETTTTQKQKLDPKKIGTVAGVEQVNKFDSDDESKIEDDLATQEQNNAVLDDQAASSTGGNYDL